MLSAMITLPMAVVLPIAFIKKWSATSPDRDREFAEGCPRSSTARIHDSSGLANQGGRPREFDERRQRLERHE
jgi:hypothetical protein